MPAGTMLLSLNEYHATYAHENGWEFWFGEAVRKPVPTWMHGLLQGILWHLLEEAGYAATVEVDLRVDPEWEPRPDVAASLEMQHPYPTKPVDIAVEVLSDDQMTHLLKKCHHYARIGVPQIFVFDPEGHRIWTWDQEMDDLKRLKDVALGNGATLTGERIWSEFDHRAAKRKN